MTGNNNMWLDGIMGVVIGDALGCPVQFESRNARIRYLQPAGRILDG